MTDYGRKSVIICERCGKHFVALAREACAQYEAHQSWHFEEEMSALAAAIRQEKGKGVRWVQVADDSEVEEPGR